MILPTHPLNTSIQSLEVQPGARDYRLDPLPDAIIDLCFDSSLGPNDSGDSEPNNQPFSHGCSSSEYQ